VGRSHRSKPGKAKLSQVIELTRQILGIPEDYRIGIVPGSDTGAVEMALWSLLGSRGVDVLAWESFGKEWVTDVTKQLKLADTRVFESPYGELPDLAKVDTDRDVIFTWNGTTSGVCVPNGDWISDKRGGLTICDATSAAFAMALPWSKLDVITWSWQKVLGGEGAQGETINTPSMLAVEDALDGLRWAESIGGLPELIRRSEANLSAVVDWQSKSAWCDFLARRPEIRSNTSICLQITDPGVTVLEAEHQARIAKDIAGLLEKEGVAFDIGSYRDAPPGLRIWGGATVETIDIKAVLTWLDYAWGRSAPLGS